MSSIRLRAALNSRVVLSGPLLWSTFGASVAYSARLRTVKVRFWSSWSIETAGAWLRPGAQLTRREARTAAMRPIGCRNGSLFPQRTLSERRCEHSVQLGCYLTVSFRAWKRDKHRNSASWLITTRAQTASESG